MVRPVKACPCCSSVSSFWFPPFANVRQQVGCTLIMSSNPKSRPAFLSFCAVQHWTRRVHSGRAWVESLVALAAQWPASSRGALGSRGLGFPSFPYRLQEIWAAALSSLRAGGRTGGLAGAGTLLWAAVATGAHSIRTCRRTLSITEATM